MTGLFLCAYALLPASAVSQSDVTLRIQDEPGSLEETISHPECASLRYRTDGSALALLRSPDASLGDAFLAALRMSSARQNTTDVVAIEALVMLAADAKPRWIETRPVEPECRFHVANIAICDGALKAAVSAVGVHAAHGSAVLPPVIARGLPCRACAGDVGIAALEYYAPDLCLRAADLDSLHTSHGRYTRG